MNVIMCKGVADPKATILKIICSYAASTLMSIMLLPMSRIPLNISLKNLRMAPLILSQAQ